MKFGPLNRWKIKFTNPAEDELETVPLLGVKVITMRDKETTSTNEPIGDEEYKVTDLLEICRKDGRTTLIHYGAHYLNLKSFWKY